MWVGMAEVMAQHRNGEEDAIELLERMEREASAARQACVAEQVQKALNLRTFNEAYATEFKAYLETGTADEPAIDFDHGLAPARFTEVGLTDEVGMYHEAPERVLPDTGGGQGLIGTRFVEWVRRVAPACITRASSRLGTAVIGGVGAGAAISTEMITIKGLTVGGHRLPTLKNIPVVPNFKGLLLPNAFNRALGLRFDYKTYSIAMDVPALGGQPAVSFVTPFTDAEGETYASMIAEVATPVAYLPELVRIAKRTELVVKCRVPMHIADGTEVFLTPLDETRSKDIGVLPAHCRSVVEGGYVKILLANPHFHIATVAAGTPLCHISTGTGRPPAEFTPDEIVAKINVGPTLTEDMVASVRELFAENDNARCSVVATKPGYVTITQCKIDTPGIDSGLQRPPRSGQVHWSAEQSEKLKPVIEAQVRDGFIAKMKSDFSSRPVLVRKPDGTYRLTVSY